MNSETSIYSFIIRFVVDQAPGEEGNTAAYHGAIRHIQSAEELNFTEWSDAVEFMRRFVPIASLNNKSNQ
ncbi:MAG: hypothetical protein ACM3Y8_03130 [Byssovorax cruenta]